MTKLLEQAIAKVRDLPAIQQDAVAQIILDEIASDAKWDQLLSRPSQKVAELADQAWAEYEAGQTEELDPESL
jgi:hypothetical protein